MSDDEVDIRHGAVVAVDSATLRQAAAELDALRAGLDEAVELGRAATLLLGDVDAELRGMLSVDASALTIGVGVAGERVAEVGGRLRLAAARYEHAELSALRLAATDPAEIAAYDARLRELEAEHPGDALGLGVADAAYDLRMPWEIIVQAWALGNGTIPGLGLAAASGVAGLGIGLRIADRGLVRADARLSGRSDPVTVTRVARGEGAPLTSLEQAARRIPGDASIRVERHTMPGGSREFVVYVAGTRGGTAFDWTSNTQLYDGKRSASYESVRDALRQAGARPGDTLHQVGHSQGAMVANRLAMEREYNVKTVVSFGSPVQAELPTSVLSVDVRHTDDPVAALAHGGSAVGVGSADSFVAQRTADPLPALHDLAARAHWMDHYSDTARMLDASPDPRMDAVRETLDRLGQATSVEVTEYTATRP
ncbi:MAG: hypothetical protein QM611_04095 [Microbacterium sp.]|uniref:hypothetical protein n=1 Tax=Microbacterium sp. TaxID=51671 RepID=UPI0039E464ED